MVKKNKIINKIAIVMGSKSDWPTMKYCADTLKKLKVQFDAKIVSAHRTPDRMYDFAKNAEKKLLCNYCWSWWISTFTRYDCIYDNTSSNRSSYRK